MHSRNNHRLGIITPDMTTTLGFGPSRAILGVPLMTWAIVLGASGAGAGVAGFAIGRSAKAAVSSSLGGIVGAAIGIGMAGYMTMREFEKLKSEAVQA